MTTAYTKSFLSGASFALFINSSSMGTTKANVLPEPVTASATTSLQDRISGITAAWIGVIFLKPCFLMQFKTGCESAGVTWAQSLITILISNQFVLDKTIIMFKSKKETNTRIKILLKQSSTHVFDIDV